MTCDEFRERTAVRLAEGEGEAGEHGGACPECARWAELARAAWEAAGRAPDEAVPPELMDRIQRTCRRPRRADLTLLRPGPLAAAAILVLGVLALLWPAKAGEGGSLLFEGDGMSVERYDLPAGTDAAGLAEEIRRRVAPEAWGEGGCGLEAGEGYLRVRATEEVHRAVRERLGRRGR